MIVGQGFGEDRKTYIDEEEDFIFNGGTKSNINYVFNKNLNNKVKEKNEINITTAEQIMKDNLKIEKREKKNKLIMDKKREEEKIVFLEKELKRQEIENREKIEKIITEKERMISKIEENERKHKESIQINNILLNEIYSKKSRELDKDSFQENLNQYDPNIKYTKEDMITTSSGLMNFIKEKNLLYYNKILITEKQESYKPSIVYNKKQIIINEEINPKYNIKTTYSPDLRNTKFVNENVYFLCERNASNVETFVCDFFKKEIKENNSINSFFFLNKYIKNYDYENNIINYKTFYRNLKRMIFLDKFTDYLTILINREIDYDKTDDYQNVMNIFIKKHEIQINTYDIFNLDFDEKNFFFLNKNIIKGKQKT